MLSCRRLAFMIPSDIAASCALPCAGRRGVGCCWAAGTRRRRAWSDLTACVNSPPRCSAMKFWGFSKNLALHRMNSLVKAAAVFHQRGWSTWPLPSANTVPTSIIAKYAITTPAVNVRNIRSRTPCRGTPPVRHGTSQFLGAGLTSSTSAWIALHDELNVSRRLEKLHRRQPAAPVPGTACRPVKITAMVLRRAGRTAGDRNGSESTVRHRQLPVLRSPIRSSLSPPWWRSSGLPLAAIRKRSSNSSGTPSGDQSR